MRRFKNKAAFITGAGGYIGGTTARMLAAEGAKVAVCDITDEACAQTVHDIVDAGVTVNSVAPGIVQRPDADAANSDYALKTNFLGRKCEATDIAETVLFLCSDAARFVTGQTWVVDGGRGLGMKGSD